MYPPDSYEELMMAAMAGNGCTSCLATTHTADICPEGRDPEPYVCDYHSDGPGWDMCSADRPCTMDPTYEEASK